MTWASLKPREKIFLLSGGAFLALLFCYLVFWVPLQAQLKKMRARLPREEAVALAMMQLDQALEHENPKATSHLKASSLQPYPPGAKGPTLKTLDSQHFLLSFEEVNFDSLMAWLLVLSQQEDLIISKALIQRKDNHGLVKAELILN